VPRSHCKKLLGQWERKKCYQIIRQVSSKVRGNQSQVYFCLCFCYYYHHYDVVLLHILVIIPWKKVGQKYLTYFAWINLFRAGNDALPLQNIVFSLSYKINFIIKRPNMSQIDAVIVFVFRLVFLNLFKSVYQFLVKWQFDGSQGTVLHIKLLYAYLGD